MTEKIDAMGCATIMLLASEIMICIGIGGIYGWAIGMIICGAIILAHTIRGIRRLKRDP